MQLRKTALLSARFIGLTTTRNDKCSHRSACLPMAFACGGGNCWNKRIVTDVTWGRVILLGKMWRRTWNRMRKRTWGHGDEQCRSAVSLASRFSLSLFSSHFPLLPAVACLAEYATDLQFHWPSSTRFDFLFKKKRCGRCGRRIVRGGMPTPANEWAASFPLFFLIQNGRCRSLRMKTLKTRRAEWPDSSSPRRRRFMCRRRLCCRLHMICRLDGGNVGQGLEQTSTAATAATAAPKKRD